MNARLEILRNGPDSPHEHSATAQPAESGSVRPPRADETLVRKRRVGPSWLLEDVDDEREIASECTAITSAADLQALLAKTRRPELISSARLLEITGSHDNDVTLPFPLSDTKAGARKVLTAPSRQSSEQSRGRPPTGSRYVAWISAGLVVAVLATVGLKNFNLLRKAPSTVTQTRAAQPVTNPAAPQECGPASVASEPSYTNADREYPVAQSPYGG